MFKYIALPLLGATALVIRLGYRFAFMPEEEWNDFINRIDEIRNS